MAGFSLCISQNRMHTVKGLSLVPQVARGVDWCSNLTKHPCRNLDAQVVHMTTLHFSYQTQDQSLNAGLKNSPRRTVTFSG